MKSVYMKAPHSICVEDQSLPVVGVEDVLIKVHTVGLCGTDLHSYRGLGHMTIFPLVLGHELGGEVCEFGSKVPEGIFSKGEAVTVKPYFNCGKCYPCTTGRVNCCKNSKTMGVQKPEGALSEYVSVNYRNVISCDGLTYPLIALIEPLCVGQHLTDRTGVKSDETVVVFGCGVIGLGAVAACSCRGARVIAVDIADDKLVLAKQMGAKYVINSKIDNLEEKLKEFAGEVQVVLEAIGLPATMAQATQLVDYGGRVGYVGYGSGDLRINSNEIIRKELGIFASRNALQNDFCTVRENLRAGQLPFEKLISRTYPMAQSAKAFADWDAEPDKFTKIQIVFD